MHQGPLTWMLYLFGTPLKPWKLNPGTFRSLNTSDWSKTSKHLKQREWRSCRTRLLLPRSNSSLSPLCRKLLITFQTVTHFAIVSTILLQCSRSLHVWWKNANLEPELLQLFQLNSLSISKRLIFFIMSIEMLVAIGYPNFRYLHLFYKTITLTP